MFRTCSLTEVLSSHVGQELPNAVVVVDVGNHLIHDEHDPGPVLSQLGAEAYVLAPELGKDALGVGVGIEQLQKGVCPNLKHFAKSLSCN